MQRSFSIKHTNTTHTEIHYVQIVDYQLPLLILPQTDDSKPLGQFFFYSNFQ